VPECVGRAEVSKSNSNGWQRAVRRPINYPVFTPMLTVADKLKGLPAKWVEGVRDTHREAGRTKTSSS